jgi:predicted NUDIX family NTP pyrophosphohydrolase
MAKTSAGILLYRRRDHALEVLLVHPGGPFFKGKDAGAWSIPKGEYLSGEDPLAAALREFQEEIGCGPGRAEPRALGEVKQASGKIVKAWAIEGDCDAEAICSNLFSIEWPPRSGRLQQFPEVDRAAWFTLSEAVGRVNPAQQEFLHRLTAIAAGQTPSGGD